MNRPTIDQFFPDNITPDDINRLFLRNPELYQYIIALDAYVDWLEEKHDDKILSEVISTPVFEVLEDWKDDLIWCPSQCYKYISYKDRKFEIYLRWRYSDPWSAEILECDIDRNALGFRKDREYWHFLDVKQWSSGQLEELKQDAEQAANQWLIENVI